MPAFLANDILRLWRTFCVNYEAGSKREPDEKKAKGKLQNYKLKHSRLLTCYSGLLYLLAVYGQKKTVSPDDALAMIELTPTQRLEWLAGQKQFETAHPIIKNLLGQYDRFLETTNAGKVELLERFLDKKKNREYRANAIEFGESVFKAMDCIGNGNPFYRVLVV